jgi:mono/diheme cytochrome c family protein
MLITMNKHTSLLAVLGTVLLASCGGEKDSPGIEYMPDMYRGPAVEAYVDYGQDPYYVGDSLVHAQRNAQSARKSPAGTIAFAADQSKALYNFPYPYANTPEDYDRAGIEVHSPLPMTQANVDKGKVIYTKFCLHCHGETGQGDGKVVTEGNYPTPPAYNGTQLAALPEGKMFHSLQYGKNLAMGSHAGQLNQEERWTVIQYVKYLQAGGKMPGAVADSMKVTAPVLVSATTGGTATK